MGPYESEGMPTAEAAPAQPDSESAPQSDNPEAENADEAGPEGVTALLPKSICPGMDVKPGQTLTLKVVRTYDDEIEVEYEKADESEGDMDKAQSDLTAMAEPAPE